MSNAFRKRLEFRIDFIETCGTLGMTRNIKSKLKLPWSVIYNVLNLKHFYFALSLFQFKFITVIYENIVVYVLKLKMEVNISDSVFNIQWRTFSQAARYNNQKDDKTPSMSRRYYIKLLILIGTWILS